MAQLGPMPPIAVAQADLANWGKTWLATHSLERGPGMEFGKVFDAAVGTALAALLGGIPVVTPSATALLPSKPDCVEVGPVRVVGGVRPQNFDVGYRPDGVRFAFDSKTLNSQSSISQNWQNMINDIATEATTVHSRFPYAVVAFMVILPAPEVQPRQLSAIVETLERLSRRVGVEDPVYLAEAISLVLWRPDSGMIDSAAPDPSSPLRIERFSESIERRYTERYKGLPPHAL